MIVYSSVYRTGTRCLQMCPEPNQRGWAVWNIQATIDAHKKMGWDKRCNHTQDRVLYPENPLWKQLWRAFGQWLFRSYKKAPRNAFGYGNKSNWWKTRKSHRIDHPLRKEYHTRWLHERQQGSVFGCEDENIRKARCRKNRISKRMRTI